ncbi:MAG: uncharacterized protein K0S74_182 [Chlamydiales bacterium]|jgi:phospholipid/cholesterol/gamma-HCH transport system ATP-binding protein|nr:uncharacterized protein [Chlamydiales bacterium]
MIVVNNLWKSFGKQTVLKGLTLKVEKGETLVILGRSGEGKSVLLRQIIGIETLDEGFVEVSGKVITGLNEKDLYEALKNIGMLFQSGALFDSMTVKDNVAFYLREHGDPQTGEVMSEAEISQRVKDVLEQVGLAGTEDKMPANLSGGMKKRAAFARLIAYRPPILLYDEPTTGLDPIMSNQMGDLIVEIQKQLDATSIVVTHDIPVALKVADRIAILDGGKVGYIDTKKNFLKGEHPLIPQFLKNAFFNYNDKITQQEKGAQS